MSLSLSHRTSLRSWTLLPSQAARPGGAMHTLSALAARLPPKSPRNPACTLLASYWRIKIRACLSPSPLNALRVAWISESTFDACLVCSRPEYRRSSGKIPSSLSLRGERPFRRKGDAELRLTVISHRYSRNRTVNLTPTRGYESPARHLRVNRVVCR